MLVSEFIEWLKKQDQGATVEVIKNDRRSYVGDYSIFVDFIPDEHANYVDMRGNPFAVGQPYENSRTLYLGEM